MKAFACVLVAFFAGCQSPGSSAVAAEPTALDLLTLWMAGSFSSAAQAAEDPENYFDIRLHMVPIWTEREGEGTWLYVEQAAASSLDRPYRQRVYHLVDTSQGPRSDVFELPGDPLAYAGAWRTPERFGSLAPADLEERTGCSIYLSFSRSAEVFVGSTFNAACPSNLRGATYATSQVSIGPGTLESWDRGFDASGEQVWGAIEGPYVFVKEPAGP